MKKLTNVLCAMFLIAAAQNITAGEARSTRINPNNRPTKGSMESSNEMPGIRRPGAQPEYVSTGEMQQRSRKGYMGRTAKGSMEYTDEMPRGN